MHKAYIHDTLHTQQHQKLSHSHKSSQAAPPPPPLPIPPPLSLPILIPNEKQRATGVVQRALNGLLRAARHVHRRNAAHGHAQRLKVLRGEVLAALHHMDIFWGGGSGVRMGGGRGMGGVGAGGCAWVAVGDASAAV